MCVSSEFSVSLDPRDGTPLFWDATCYYYDSGLILTYLDGALVNIEDGLPFDGSSSYSDDSISSLFYEITDAYSFNNFVLRDLLANFESVPGYSSIESSIDLWNAYCIQQGDANVCMIASLCDLLLTYARTTVHDCVWPLTPAGLFNAISACVTQNSLGTLEATFVYDANQYLSSYGDGCYLNYGDGMGMAPFLANYHMHGDILHGHTAMVIGNGQSDYWWIFKTYWDIVLTWAQNFNSATMEIDSKDTKAIRIIDHQYQTETYCLCRNSILVTKYN